MNKIDQATCEMKKKMVVNRDKRGKKPAIRTSKKFDPIPAQWWKGKGSEEKDRDDDRRGRDW